MQFLPFLVVVQHLLGQLRNVDARIALPCNVELVALELTVLSEELDESNQIVPCHRSIVLN